MFVHAENPIAQLMSGLLVCCVAVAVCLAVAPYQRRGDALVANSALLQLLLTMLLAVAIMIKVLQATCGDCFLHFA
jgi:hypothetical protein